MRIADFNIELILLTTIVGKGFNVCSRSGWMEVFYRLRAREYWFSRGRQPGMSPQVQVLGVYSNPVDDGMVAAQARELYGPNPSPSQAAQTREQLESAALIEVLVSNADTKFDLGDFTQEDPNTARGNWQVAYAQAFLSLDGERLLTKRWSSPPSDQKTFRVAFYIHFWKPGQPLLSSYGSLPAPVPARMPERLARLVPYVLVD